MGAVNGTHDTALATVLIRPEELAISSNPESSARGEVIGVGAAFGVTVTVISLVAGQELALALMMGSGGGLMYALGWRLHRSSQQER